MTSISNVRRSTDELFHVAVLFLVCVLTYLPGSGNAFVVDDYLFLNGQYDTVFRSLADYFTVSRSQHYQPLYYLLNDQLFSLFGADPLPYRLINIALLWAASLSLYTFLTMLNEKKGGMALIASILFAVHPYTANSVLQITHNVVFLCMIGMLCALMAYLRYLRKQRVPDLIVALAWFLISLMCVEASLLTPVYLIAVLTLFDHRTPRQAVLAAIPFLAFIGLFLIVWFKVALGNLLIHEASTQVSVSLGAFISTYAALLGWFLKNLIVPQGVALSVNVLHPELSWTAVTLFIAGVAAAIYLWNVIKEKEGRLAVIWLAAGVIYVIPALLSHRYMGMVLSPHWLLIPSIGACILAAHLLTSENLSPLLKRSFPMLLVFYFLFFTLDRQARAATRRSFAQSWVRASPQNGVALFEWANALVKDDAKTEAIDVFERLLATGAYRSREGVVYANLASLYLDTGDPVRAAALARQAIDTGATRAAAAVAYNTLGVINVQKEDRPAAKTAFQHAVAQNPQYTPAIFNLSDMYIVTGEEEKAIELLEQASRQSFAAADRHMMMALLAALYLKRHDVARGFEYLERIVKENPSFESFQQIASALQALGFEDLAGKFLEAAFRTYPEQAQEHMILHRK